MICLPGVQDSEKALEVDRLDVADNNIALVRALLKEGPRFVRLSLE
jgi:hypothetical protein